MCMLRFENLRHMRIVGLDYWTSLEIDAEVADPEGSHGDGDSNVFEDAPAEVKIAGSILEVGFNEPEEIEGLGEDHPLADAREALLVALDVAREQHGERNEPVEDEVESDDDAPVAADAIEVPGNLFGQVAGPDDEELREAEIDVEHDEGEGHLAEVVLFGGAQDRLERLAFRQTDGGENRKR